MQEQVIEIVEKELETAWTRHHDQDLLDNPNSKELPPDWDLIRFWALSKCQFGDTVGKAMWHAFLHRLLP